MMFLSPRLADALLPQYPELSREEFAAVRNHAIDYTTGAVRSAPAHVRFGVMGLSLALAVWLIVNARRPGDVARALGQWEKLTGTPGRALLRLMRTLALFGFLEHPLVLAKLGVPQVTDRQASFRALRALQISAARPLD